MPLLAALVVAPVILSGETKSAFAAPRLDEVTRQGLMNYVERPVDWAPQPTTTTAAPTTTTTAAPPTTTTLPPSAIGNSGTFALPPGAKLPSDKECAKAVKKVREVRPENKAANSAKPPKLSVAPNWGNDPAVRNYTKRITGNHTGTTDELIQWAACKWGMEADAVRAQVWVESTWRQPATAGVELDQARCPVGMTAPCPQAFGLLQIRNDFHPGTYPWTASSTAFNLDYGLAMKRACYDGHLWVGPQGKGDAWGCVGVHYSGTWLDEPAKQYIARVQAAYETKPWLKLR